MSGPFDKYLQRGLQHTPELGGSKDIKAVAEHIKQSMKERLEIDEKQPKIQLPDRERILEEDLAALLNGYNCESDSGTPDFILADYLKGCLDVYNRTLKARAAWRGESVELPALKALREEQDADPHKDDPRKTVPLVTYENGRRNEIGEARIFLTPGEQISFDVIEGAIVIRNDQPNA